MATHQKVRHVHVEKADNSSRPTQPDVYIRVQVNCPVCNKSVYIQPIRIGFTPYKGLLEPAGITGSIEAGLNVDADGHCSRCGTSIRLTLRCFKEALRRAMSDNGWTTRQVNPGW